MKLSLVVLHSGRAPDKPIPINISEFLIGRAPECHLRPASSVISKRHCGLIRRDGKFYLRDFGSTNGTFLNDKRITGEVELHHDDCVKVGPLTFRVQLVDESAKQKTGGKKKAGRSLDEDAIAEMLLELDDETSFRELENQEELADPDATEEAANADGFSETCEMEVPKKVSEEPKSRKVIAEDTSDAAKVILEKYMRKPQRPV